MMRFAPRIQSGKPIKRLSLSIGFPRLAISSSAILGSTFVPRRGGADSVEAARFKQALRDSFTLAQASARVGAIPAKRKLELDKVADDFVTTIEPRRTIPKRILAGIFVPPRILGDMSGAPAETFVEPMVYPVIDLPMYEPLKNLSSEPLLAQYQFDRAEQHHASGNKPTFHRVVHGRPQSRVRA